VSSSGFRTRVFIVATPPGVGLTLRPASDETVMIPVPPSPDATMRTPVVSATGPTEPDGATIPLDVGWGQ